MRRRAWLRALVLMFAAIAVVVAAYATGKFASGYYRSRDRDRAELARSINTEHILSVMKTIRVGDTIPDHRFVDADGNRVTLGNKLVNDHTLLLFIDASCPSCLAEMEILQNVVSDANEATCFLLLSRDNLAAVKRLRKAYSVGCSILIDTTGAYQTNLNLLTTPFSVLVDKDRRIEKIIAGSLREDDFAGILRSNR